MKLLLTTAVLLPLASAFAFTPFRGAGAWENYKLLPQYELSSSLYTDADDIANDINNGRGEYFLDYKVKGGSSHQVFVKRRDGKVMGLWSAPNHATYIEGEIFAFTVSRLLNRSQWSTFATRMTFEGNGHAAAKAALNSPKTPKSRACNRDTILSYMKANPYYITGVYKGFRSGESPEAIPGLVDTVHQQRLNSNHFIVKFLSKDSPKPTGRAVYFNNGTLSYQAAGPTSPKSTDIELAKQLSFLTIVDAINSQRDRFGPYGSNMEAMVLKNGTFKIALVDNGGIADSSQTASLKYFIGANGVSRFEKEVFNKIIALDDFIQRGVRSPLVPYASVDELKKALGYETYPSEPGSFASPASCKSPHTFLFASLKSRWDKRFASFTAGLKAVAAHMRQFQGNKNAFFE